MIQPIDGTVSVPLIWESTRAGVVVVADTTTTLVFRLACGHASSIHVMLESTVALASVDLIMHSGGNVVESVINIAGAVPAATPTALKYTGAMGVTYDVRVTRVGVAGSADVYTKATTQA